MGLFDDHYRCGRLAREKNHSVESMFSQGCIFLAKDASSCRPKSLSIDLENTSPCVRCPINDHWAIDKLHRALIHRYSQGSILATFTHIHTIYPLSSFPSKLRQGFKKHDRSPCHHSGFVLPVPFGEFLSAQAGTVLCFALQRSDEGKSLGWGSCTFEPQLSMRLRRVELFVEGPSDDVDVDDMLIEIHDLFRYI